MAKGRQLKGRIRSVQNTRKITRTMELVATSKMKRAQEKVVGARPFAEALDQAVAITGLTPELRVYRAHGLHVFERNFLRAEEEYLQVQRERPGVTKMYDESPAPASVVAPRRACSCS